MGANSSKNTPYGDTTTAEEVANVHQNQIVGKYVVITGGNSGLGLETSRVLSLNGAKVVICSRSLKAGEAAVAKLMSQFADADVTCMQLDLASLKSVKAFCDAYIATGKPLNLLINNAGIMACPLARTADGIESQFGVNYLGHYSLTSQLLPLLVASGTAREPSRVVNLSSCANWSFATPQGVNFEDLNAEKGYDSWLRYGESKLCTLLWTKELQRRLTADGSHVLVLSVHPGIINGTAVNKHTDIPNLVSFVSHLYAVPGGLWFFSTERYKSIPEGAATSVFCAVATDVLGGQYYADCGPSDRVHPQAHDGAAAARLWEATEKILADIEAARNK